MRKITFLLVFGHFSICSYSQQPSYTPVAFFMKSNSSFLKESFFNPELKISADSALVIAAAVFNSQEFRDSIAQYSFPCRNYDNKCKRKCKTCEDIIPANVIFDSLYRKKRDSLILTLLNDGDKGGSFGFSYEDNFEITSHYITIENDDPELSFAYKFAYHICHEYMHIVGFYHYQKPKRRIRDKDIAEQTGWTAYYILKRWQSQGVKIPGLNN